MDYILDNDMNLLPKPKLFGRTFMNFKASPRSRVVVPANKKIKDYLFLEKVDTKRFKSSVTSKSKAHKN